MASKAKSFKIDDKTKTIIVYTNVEQNPAEEKAMKMYVSMGYTLKFAEKKAKFGVKEMRAKLKNDPKALEEFNKIYKTKASKDATKEEKSEVGFFGACKYYNNWAKKNGEEEADAE